MSIILFLLGAMVLEDVPAVNVVLSHPFI